MIGALLKKKIIIAVVLFFAVVEAAEAGTVGNKSRRMLLESFHAEPGSKVCVAFFDADGTLRPSMTPESPAKRVEEVTLLPFVAQGIARARNSGCLVVIVSNQSGVGKFSTFEQTETALFRIVELLREAGTGVHFFDFAEFKDEDRKPGIGMALRIEEFLQREYEAFIDKERSFMVGDAGWAIGETRPDGLRAFSHTNADRVFAERFGIRFIEASHYFGWQSYGFYSISAVSDLDRFYRHNPSLKPKDYVSIKVPRETARLPRAMLNDFKSQETSNPRAKSVLNRFRSIPLVGVFEFSEWFAQNEARVFNAGYFGVVFRSRNEREVAKTAHVIYADAGFAPLNPARTTYRAREVLDGDWKDFTALPQVAALDNLFAGYGRVPVGGVPVIEELFGEALWAVMTEGYEPVFASAVTRDGLALIRPFIEGVPLKAVLESQRTGTDLHKGYDVEALLRQVVKLQMHAEGILLAKGVTVDMLTPGNFLIQGHGAGATVRPFDFALVEPSEQARAEYKRRGKEIPPNVYAPDLKTATSWPLLPEHVVYSHEWGLSRDQVLMYVKALIEYERGPRRNRRPVREQDVLNRLARIPVLSIDAAPLLVNPAHVEWCKKLLGI